MFFVGRSVGRSTEKKQQLLVKVMKKARSVPTIRPTIQWKSSSSSSSSSDNERDTTKSTKITKITVPPKITFYSSGDSGSETTLGDDSTHSTTQPPRLHDQTQTRESTHDDSWSGRVTRPKTRHDSTQTQTQEQTQHQSEQWSQIDTMVQEAPLIDYGSETDAQRERYYDSETTSSEHETQGWLRLSPPSQQQRWPRRQRQRRRKR